MRQLHHVMQPYQWGKLILWGSLFWCDGLMFNSRITCEAASYYQEPSCEEFSSSLSTLIFWGRLLLVDSLLMSGSIRLAILQLHLVPHFGSWFLTGMPAVPVTISVSVKMHRFFSLHGIFGTGFSTSFPRINANLKVFRPNVPVFCEEYRPVLPEWFTSSINWRVQLFIFHQI